MFLDLLAGNFGQPPRDFIEFVDRAFSGLSTGGQRVVNEFNRWSVSAADGQPWEFLGVQRKFIT